MRAATGKASSATTMLFSPSTRPMKPSPRPLCVANSGDAVTTRPMLKGKTNATAAKPRNTRSRDTDSVARVTDSL